MNEEEREGHEDDIILFHVNSFGSYLTSVKRKSNHFPSITQTEKFEAHPLYKLHLAFLIWFFLSINFHFVEAKLQKQLHRL